MAKVFKLLLLVVCVVGLLTFTVPEQAEAQVVYSTYYAPAPAVGYVPARYGLFGRRIYYRPVVTYPAPVTTYYAPAPVTSYYAPAPTVVARPVRSYYVAPTVVARPVTTYYAPAPVTTYYPPVYGY